MGSTWNLDPPRHSITKHFRYLKWRNPHLCKQYVRPAYVREFPPPKQPKIRFSTSKLLLMAEILHQLIGSWSPYLWGFIHPRWCRISAINSRSLNPLVILPAFNSPSFNFCPTRSTAKAAVEPGGRHFFSVINGVFLYPLKWPKFFVGLPGVISPRNFQCSYFTLLIQWLFRGSPKRW